MKKKIVLDFDGVIHSYTSPWVDAETIPDPPVPGAIEYIRMLLNLGYAVEIFSSRNNYSGGPIAMEDYLVKNGLTWDEIFKIRFPKYKPNGHIFIDDRGFTFEGVFPPIEFIENFKQWNKRDGKSTTN